MHPQVTIVPREKHPLGQTVVKVGACRCHQFALFFAWYTPSLFTGSLWLEHTVVKVGTCHCLPSVCISVRGTGSSPTMLGSAVTWRDWSVATVCYPQLARVLETRRYRRAMFRRPLLHPLVQTHFGRPAAFKLHRLGCGADRTVFFCFAQLCRPMRRAS